MRFIFDCETNGLLDELSCIHSLVLKDIDSGRVLSYAPGQIEEGLKILMAADLIVGHNVIDFDIPAFKKVYPWFHISEAQVRDTLVLSYLLWPNLSDLDGSTKKQAWPSRPQVAKLKGSHSLKAWGHRLGYHKLDYDGGWAAWSPEMQYYCEIDVEVTERLWTLIESLNPSEMSVELEHQVKWIVCRQERYGVAFDSEASNALVRELMKRRAELEAELQDTFRPWVLEELFIPKVNNAKRGYVKGEPFIKKTTVVFNPNSRAHIADRLIALYGWKPREKTEGGGWKVDETVLASLPYPPAKALSEIMLIQKRLGMVAEGKQAWLNYVVKGRIHGRVLTNFAVSGRASHRSPNLAQVTSVKKGKDGKVLYLADGGYGYESRACFTASKGRVLVGADVSGLELRLLSHFMRDLAYTQEVISGDIHTTNMKAFGFYLRASAKTGIYALIYGAGDGKLGMIQEDDALAAGQPKPKGPASKRGKQIRANIMGNIPALGKLVDNVKKACKRGYLKGLDGRHLHIRSDHSALNVLIQSAGALICKRWLVEVDLMIKEKGWHNMVQQVLWVHDEAQFDCVPEIADEFAKECLLCIEKAQAFFNINVPLTGEAKVGANWAETH